MRDKTVRILSTWLTVFPILVACVSLNGWAGDVNGHYRERTVKGVPSSPWHEFYEWNAFCCPIGASTNRTCRTGACEGTLTHDGAYIYPGMPDGPATIYCDQPNFFAAPKVKELTISGATYMDTAPNTDYFMAFGQDSSSWGGSPWEWYSGTWYQTFVATGTGINRVSFKLAAPADTVTVAIHESNGGSVSSWPQVGSLRTVDAGCTGCDVWVAWPHGNVSTTPGQTYAVSFQNSGGNMGFYVHRDSVGTGYSSGTAYHDDTAQSYDLYAVVFSDNDGTVLTYQMDSPDIGPSTEWAGAWAQSFTAQGTSLAAVGLFAQGGGDAQWDADVLIFNDLGGGVQGSQVGPTKNLPDAGWYGPGTGFGGMSYNPGEVPLTPGQQYLVVFSPWDSDGGGFNPLRRPGGNVLPGGTAYIGSGGTWSARPYDLSMTIMEYGGTGPVATPTVTPTPPEPLTGIIENYEDPFVSGLNQDWTAWADPWGGMDEYAPRTGRSGSGNSQGIRVYNGSGGAFRTNIPVSPGEEYYLTTWIKTMNAARTGGAPSSVWAEWGYDLLNRDFATLGSDPEISWWDTAPKTPGNLASTSWQQFTSPTFTAPGPFISIWVKAGASSDPQGIYMFIDDWELIPLSLATATPTDTVPPPATSTPTATFPMWTPETGINPGAWMIYR